MWHKLWRMFPAEAEAAQVLWNRSFEKHKMRYKFMVSDCDSKSFSAVEDTYDGVKVEKIDCVGHIQKIMGKHLLKSKSSTKGKLKDGKTIGGRGRLTEAKIKQLQRYYDLAIWRNVNILHEIATHKFFNRDIFFVICYPQKYFIVRQWFTKRCWIFYFFFKLQCKVLRQHMHLHHFSGMCLNCLMCFSTIFTVSGRYFITTQAVLEYVVLFVVALNAWRNPPVPNWFWSSANSTVVGTLYQAITSILKEWSVIAVVLCLLTTFPSLIISLPGFRAFYWALDYLHSLLLLSFFLSGPSYGALLSSSELLPMSWYSFSVLKRTWINFILGIYCTVLHEGPCSPTSTSHVKPAGKVGLKYFSHAFLIPFSVTSSSESNGTNTLGPTL